MPTSIPAGNAKEEPLRRFYPSQDEQPEHIMVSERKKRGDAAYLAHRHPILLQRLYNAADILLDSYPEQSFIYDAYPDYLSLQLMRDRLLREASEITEAFLQEGCPIIWLNHLTDTVISELLCRKRCNYRKPNGDANTTSVRFVPRS